MHLVTKEAIELYLKRLAPGGMMVMKITNKFVDIRPIVRGFAKEFVLEVAVPEARIPGTHLDNDGSLSVTFCVLSNHQDNIDSFRDTHRWKEVNSQRGAKVSTDEHSNTFDILDWLPTI